MSDDDVVRPMPSRPHRRPADPRVRRWQVRILSVLVPLLLVAGSLLRFWVDLLWFEELGQRAVLVTRLQWGTALGIAFGVFVFLVLFGNAVIARRVARDDLYVPFLAVGANPEAPEQPVVPHFVLRPVLLGVSAVAAVIAGLVMSSHWETVLRFLGRSDFGVDDPHFGKDASFYVFTMPLLELVARSLQVVLVLAAIMVVLAYVATGVIRYTPVPRIARTAIVHLSWLVAAFLVVSAFQFRLSMWDLATSTRGYVAGAGWTDVHARIPGYWVMIVASLVLAVLVVLYARRERWRVVSGAVVGWFVASVVVTGIVPSLVQKVLVEPNELERETKVITGNIANTHAAFDLASISTSKFDARASLDRAQLVSGNTGTTDNLRLWSPFELGKVVQQEQALRRYYTFNTPDVDRYMLGDDYRQVMVSVRELEPGANAGTSWTNERLAYTHGYGAVATLPNEVTSEGRPEYLLRNLPPEATKEGEPLALDRPEVYYGEEGNDFVIVASKRAEVSGARGEDADGESDGASAQETARTSYAGDGGIRMSGFARRIAFASTFRDPRILFSGQFTDRSRLMFRRTIEDRVTELAPFLELDADPYAVIVDGRIKWIVDAYTTSDRFPYSQSVELERDGRRTSVNYMRNSVKAVVDAYDGDVTLYVADDDDPILRSWRDIFPKLFTDIDEMPKALRAHVRYPEDFFTQQTKLWLRYHMTDVADFYGNEDLWDVPTIGKDPMAAFYVLAKLPGEKSEELLLIRPLTPFNRKNMTAYMVARSDGKHYGEVRTLRLSSQRLTEGPSQVQARIKQDTEVSRQVREWTTANNTVIFGDLLVLPIEDSLVYAQPVYLENQEAQIPEFQRLVLVLGDTIAWGDDFAAAAENLLSERGDDVNGAAADGGASPAGDGEQLPTPAAGDFEGLSREELQQVLADVGAAYDAAERCQRDGDFVCFAEQVQRVQRLLDEARSGGTKDS